MTRDDIYNTIPPIVYHVRWNEPPRPDGYMPQNFEVPFENYRAALAFARLRVVEGYRNVEIAIDTDDHVFYLGRMITQRIENG